MIAAFLGINVWLIGYYYRLRRQSSRTTWEELLARLTSTDRDNIARLALELVDESGERRALEGAVAEDMGQERIWGMIGGLKGLEVLEKNSEVLIDLAAYVQRWYPEAVVIAERLRMDARELKWHVSRLRGAAQTGNLQISFPFYAQRAVVSYYLMTRRLLSLYESASFPMLADLQRAL